MCGPSGPVAQHSGPTTGPRALRRNISNSSSSAVNNQFAAASCSTKDSIDCMPHDQPDDRAAQPDTDWVGDYGVVSSLNGATSILEACIASLEPAEPSVPPTQLLLGTSAGLFLVNLKTQDIQLLGLQDCTVGQVSYHNGMAYAACPILDTGDLSAQQQHAAAAAAGLYSIDLSSTQSSVESSPLDSTYSRVQKLWDGNARCTAVTAGPAEASSCSSSTPRIYLGTQPADMLYSDDRGASWFSTGLSEAPASQQWYHRLPPYESCVSSISCNTGSPGSPRHSIGSGCSWGTDCSAQHHHHQPEVLVGVQVGGVYSCNPSQATTEEDPNSMDSELPWAEHNQGLCKDVNSLQRDPWSSKRLYAVAGSGSLPGGVYRSRGQGQKWKRLFGYRYSVGMTISPYEKGRMMLLSADKPPEIGTNLFESIDGGRHWINLTDDIHDALRNVTNFAPGLFENTPVCMYVPGGLIVACVTGHVFKGQSVSGGGYSNWQLLCELPAGVHCACITDESVAPASISRV